jgi:hypothetical protein
MAGGCKNLIPPHSVAGGVIPLKLKKVVESSAEIGFSAEHKKELPAS